MSLAKQFTFHKECRDKLFKGIKIMYDSVSATLGPHGRTVLLKKVSHTMETTKDGVTVADEVYSSDEFEDMGMQLIREASQKANTMAGDATTTAIVLAYHMCKEAIIAVSKRANVYLIGRGMKKAVDAAVAVLNSIKKDITEEADFKKVASISTQDEEVGGIIASCFVKAGKNGSIDIERSDEPGIKVERTEGLSFDKGWNSHPSFSCYLNDKRGKRAVMEDVPVLVVEKKIENENQLIPIMEFLIEMQSPMSPEERNGWPLGTKKLLVICDDFSGSALGLLVANNKYIREINGRAFHLVFVKAPSYGVHKLDIMKDICAVTGATFISEEHGGNRVEYADVKHLGRAKKVIIEDKKTIIVADDKKEKEETTEGGVKKTTMKERVNERLELLQAQLADMPQDHIDRQELEWRQATMTDGISVLKVGAESESERHELRRRVEDGVRAVRSAREEGVTPGCGVGLLRCVGAIDEMIANEPNADQRKGMEIVRKALHSVTLRLLEVAFIEKFNASWWYRLWHSPETQRMELVEEMKRNMATGRIQNCGYDFENDTLGDMMRLGVWDAKKAVRVALESAGSVARNFMKIDVAIGEVNDDEDLIKKLQERLLTQR